MSSFSINTNLNALSARRHLSQTNQDMNKRLQNMASGMRINSASDDAAGLAISEKMRSQMRGTSQSVQALQDGLSMLQTAEGGSAQVQKNLQRMRELSLKAANDTVGQQGREAIQTEVSQLKEEINRMTDTVEFNGKKLLNGDISKSEGGAVLHAGANKNETVKATVSAMDTETLGVNEVDVTSRNGAEQALESITGAINQVSTERASMGATQNRLEGAVDFLQIQNENQQASESRIRDANMAAEATALAKDQILAQAGTSTLGQAMNLQGETASQLLG